MAELKIYRPVKPKSSSSSKSSSKTEESKHWSSFKTHQITDLTYSISSISFSPISPHDFAATYSTSLALFSPQIVALKTNISSFTDVAYSASFRSDGRLIAAASHSGKIKVFDVNRRKALRTLVGHNRPVHLAKYPVSDNLHLFSGGDDGVVRYWDVAGESQLVQFTGHKDYVRCGDGSPVNSDMFVTGSYDHTVRLWDARVANLESMLSVNHGHPVEDVIFLPSGGLIATAGGNVVKIWDVIGGGKLLHTMASHNKTVTSICMGKVGQDCGDESDQYRVLSVSLDGHMKVFDYSKMKITHSVKYPAPLMSISVSPDCKTRAIGTSNGVIYVGKRKIKENAELVLGEYAKLLHIEPKKRVLKATHFRYFHRGQGEKPSEGDYVVAKMKSVKLAEHDKLLKKFRHKEALVSALSGKKDPGNVVAVIEELVARKKLMKCVSNLETEELGLLLAFLQKYLSLPMYSSLLMNFSKKVLELRGGDIRNADSLKGHVRNIKRAVEEEIRIQQSLLEIQGIISPMLRIAGRK